MNVVPCFEAKKEKTAPVVITGSKIKNAEGVYLNTDKDGRLADAVVHFSISE